MTNETVPAGFRAGFSDFIQSLTTPRILLTNLTTALIIAILNITSAVSVGALVFSGQLSPYLAMGAGLFLVGNAITAILLPLGTPYKANIASVRTGQGPVFAAIAAAIVLAMPGQPLEAVAVTAAVGILTATVVSAAVMYGLGWARLGGLARYIPYPVLGGFFAGLGYLTALGGVTVAAGPSATLSDPATLLNAQALVLLLPAAVFALLLLVLERRITHWLFTPAFLIFLLALFYAVLLATGTSVEQAAVDHWLPAASAGNLSFFPVITPAQLSLVDWSAVAGQAATFAVLALLSVIMLLLDISGLEIVINRDLDPNRELKTGGAINLAAALGSGSLSFQSLADTAFAHKLGGDRFVMILIYVAITVGVIFAGPAPMAYVPNFILGGLLLYVGLAMLIQWIWTARTRLPLSDYIVVLVILVVVATYGILEGVAIGIALATILFVHRYSRLSVIRASMTGSEYMTKTDRAKGDQAFLDQHGAAVRLFVLQGFLFFGSASRLLELIKTNLADRSPVAPRFLVIDFRRVDAMDTSAVNSFTKLMQICQRDGIGLALCDCSPAIAHALDAARREIGADRGAVVFFRDVEDGVGWCNDEILSDRPDTATDDDPDPERLLAALFGDHAAAARVSTLFKALDLPDNATIFSQGDPGDALYLLARGSVAITLDLPEGQMVMVRTMREGSIFGEMALYTGAVRSASAITREPCILLKLDKVAFARLQAEHPAECGRFHTYIIQLMADRIARANKEIVALTR